MTNLDDIKGDTIIEVGTIFRIYGVNRFDVMKIASDRHDKDKKKVDFYEYILVEYDNNIFMLVDITLDSPNRGTIFAKFKIENNNKFQIDIMKKYFENEFEIFIK